MTGRPFERASVPCICSPIEATLLFVSTLAEIEEAVAKLPPEQFSELLRKMQERDAETWDREMEEDAKSGRLDALHAHLEQENAGAPEVPLDDFLNQSELPKTL